MHAKISKKYASNGVTVRIDAVNGTASVLVGKRFFNDPDKADRWIAERWAQFRKAGAELRAMGYL